MDEIPSVRSLMCPWRFMNSFPPYWPSIEGGRGADAMWSPLIDMRDSEKNVLIHGMFILIVS